MKRHGVDQIFFAGTSLTEMADYVKKHYGKPRKRTGIKNQDLALARELTALKTLREKPKSESKTESSEGHRLWPRRAKRP